MAVVLCTGAEESLLQTRALMLEQAGHDVMTAMTMSAVTTACKNNPDVAVIGEAN